MNNIGKNKTLWLKKIGCIFTDEDLGYEGEKGTIVRTSKGCFVTLADLENNPTVYFIYKHRLSKLDSSSGEAGHIGIGFSEKEQAWYGWTHRGYGKFYVGYEVKEGSIMDVEPHKYPYKVETLEQAEQLARDISDYLD